MMESLKKWGVALTEKTLIKKICYFVNSDWYFKLHWLDRAIAAKNAGYEVIIMTDFISQDIKEHLAEIGFRCITLSVSEQSINPYKFIKAMVKSWRLLRKINPDIIHCITIKPCLIGGIYARVFKKPVILAIVGLGRVFNDSSLSIKLIRKAVLPVYSFIFKNKQCLLTFEHSGDREVLLGLTPVKVSQTCIIDGAGVNTAVFGYSPEINNDVPIVLFASRLLWKKGLGDLVEAKKKLQSEGIEFTLQVAGISSNNDVDSIPINYLEKWQEEGVLTWLGKSDNIPELIIRSNIVALPSVYAEGIPRILLEASSVGRSCIAYDVGGCRSIIRNNISGFLIERGNLEQFTGKLKELITEPSIRTRMGKASREIVLNKFSSSIIIKDTLKLYSTILTKHSL